jgi:hypothetical protein
MDYDNAVTLQKLIWLTKKVAPYVLIVCYWGLFTIFERWHPAEKGNNLTGYWLNIKISGIHLIAGYALGGLGVAALAKAGAIFGFGLIDLRFAAGGNFFYASKCNFLSNIRERFFLLLVPRNCSPLA